MSSECEKNDFFLISTMNDEKKLQNAERKKNCSDNE